MMKFADIKFGERGGSRANGLGLLTAGYWVEKEYFELAWTLIRADDPARDWHGKHTTVSLCNDPTWKNRRVGKRIKIGRCVKYFVNEQMVPLSETNKGKGGSRRYIGHNK